MGRLGASRAQESRYFDFLRRATFSAIRAFTSFRLIADALFSLRRCSPDGLSQFLEDSSYAVRQKASTELLKLGERVVPAINKRLASAPPLETRKRLEDVRDRLTSYVVLTDDKLRLGHAIEVLEHIATPEGRQVLQNLADGAPGAFSTTTAQAALARFTKR